MIVCNQPKNLLEAAHFSNALPKGFTHEITEGRYLVKLAETSSEIESALRLRYEVFNLELAAPANQCADNFGLESDEYDSICRHLIVIDRLSGKTVGTYRLNSLESAQTVEGFYSYNEFSLEDLPVEILRQAIEIGRACIAREHRSSKVLFLLWKCLLNHLQDSRKRYFFGCCSLFSQDCSEAAKVYQYFVQNDLLNREVSVRPRPERRSTLDEQSPSAEPIELPNLFNLYLKIGVKICGAPAIDRQFGTIDFFVLFDLYEMNEKCRKMFFRRKPAISETIQTSVYG